MKQFDRDSYVALLRLWDKKHHLLGNSEPHRLYKESVDALKSIDKSLYANGVLDLGAGNGILGIPALLEGFAEKVVLIEPLVKRIAFLEAVRGEMRRVGDPRLAGLFVMPQTVQNVSRETLEKQLGPSWSQALVMTRAFSGANSLKDAVSGSVLSENPLRKFSVIETSNSKKYVLVPEIDP